MSSMLDLVRLKFVELCLGQT
ncbi:hypothetical protein PSAC2689_10236 [Paraburkholderia sacchari]